MSIFTKKRPTAAELESRIAELKSRLDTVIPAAISEARESFASSLATGENVEGIKRRLFDLEQEQEALPRAIEALHDELFAADKAEAVEKIASDKKAAARILDEIASAWRPVVSAFEEFRAAAVAAGIASLPGYKSSPSEILERLHIPDFSEQASEAVRLYFHSKEQQAAGNAERRHRARLSA